MVDAGLSVFVGSYDKITTINKLCVLKEKERNEVDQRQMVGYFFIPYVFIFLFLFLGKDIFRCFFLTE